MHNKLGKRKYSIITTGLLFSGALAVFIAAGQPNQSMPVVSNFPDNNFSLYATSVQENIPGSAPNQYYQANTQAAANQIPSNSTQSAMKVVNTAQTMSPVQPAVPVQPFDAQQPANSESQVSTSDLKALAGKPADTNKTAASAEKPVSYRFVNANELNIRSGAGTDYDKVGTLKRGEKVGLISTSGEWAKIQTTSGKTGYTILEYLVSSQSAVEPEQPVAYWYVNADTLNVRSGAGTDSEKIATLKRGDKVGFFAGQGEWARIQTSSGKTGYALLKYLVEDQSDISRGSSDSSASSATTTLAQQIADYSTRFQGIRYVYGGESTKGFDCSGFVQYVYSHFGISVPRSASEYTYFGQKVSRDNLRPSDILLFDTDGGGWDVSHVGIYLGGDKFIHASTTKGEVIVMSLSDYRGKYYGARRVID